MKLCRFVLHTVSEEARSGIFYDNRVYETDGERAAGIHEVGDVQLLAPIGVPGSVRIFHAVADDEGEPQYGYSFGNPARIVGPNSIVELPEAADEIDFHARLCLTLADAGEAIDADEAASFVLGYSLMIDIESSTARNRERALSLPPGKSRDLPIAIGPFIVTPDDLTDHLMDDYETQPVLKYKLSVSDEVIAEGTTESDAPFAELLQIGSQFGPVHPGEIIGGLSIPKPPLKESDIGRPLLAGDTIEFLVEKIGTLVIRFE